jgi:hypothetical protein
VFEGAEIGDANLGDCADAMGAANSVMATERAETRRTGTKVFLVKLTSTGQGAKSSKFWSRRPGLCSDSAMSCFRV